MSVADDMKATAVADSGAGGVYTLLTGGIYTFADTGRLGIGNNKPAAAFDTTTRKLKPCGVVKARPQVADGQIADDVTQDVSYRQVVEWWLYADGDAGYGTLETVAARLFVLFHGKVASGRISRWLYTMEQSREDALQEAAMLRVDFETLGVL